MKINITPFREFWLDCYSTAIYSILLSKTDIDKIYVYNNNYIYQESRIDFFDGSVVWSITSKMDMTEIIQKILENIRFVNFKEEKNPIFLLKSLLCQEQIVFLGVDIYYWISDNFNWHRNHFNHYSLLNGFDEKKGIFYVLETGNMGYKQYEISEEELLHALKSFTGNSSMIAKLNYDVGATSYDKKEFTMNARNIINSIKEVIDKKDMFLKEADVLDEKYWTVLDHIQTHLYGMESRQKANRLLISTLYMHEQKNIYASRFNRLEKKYNNLKRLVLANNIGHKHVFLSDLRDEIIQCLCQEKRIWQDIIKNI